MPNANDPLVAATALGISLSMLWYQALANDDFLAYGFGGWGVARRTRFAAIALASLITASFAVLALRARRPRPRMWLLSRRPGTVACIASSLVVTAQLLALPLDIHTVGDASPFLVAAYYWPPSIAAVVLSSWVVLALGRRWRFEGDWVEWMGMLVGACWIGLLPALIFIDRY